MAYGKKSHYGGGGYLSNEAIEKVPTPDKIRCTRCLKVKNPFCFSEKRIRELKEKIVKMQGRFDPVVTHVISCTQCTGGNVTELRCHMCRKTKGLDKFSKQQRRTPDQATCNPCMYIRQNIEPGGRDSDEEGESGSGRDSSDSGDSSDDPNQSTITGTYQGIDKNGSALSSKVDTTHATSSTGGVKLPLPPHMRPKASTTASSEASSSRATIGAPTAAAGNTMQLPFRGSQPSRRYTSLVASTKTQKTSGNGKWAKIPAGPSKTSYDVVPRGAAEDEDEEEDEGRDESSDDSYSE